MKREMKINLLYKLAIVIGSLALTISIVFLVLTINQGFINSTFKLDLNNSSLISDFFGGVVGSLLSFVGILLLFIAIEYQRQDLNRQKNDSNLTRVSDLILKFRDTYLSNLNALEIKYVLKDIVSVEELQKFMDMDIQGIQILKIVYSKINPLTGADYFNEETKIEEYQKYDNLINSFQIDRVILSLEDMFRIAVGVLKRLKFESDRNVTKELEFLIKVSFHINFWYPFFCTIRDVKIAIAKHQNYSTEIEKTLEVSRIEHNYAYFLSVMKEYYNISHFDIHYF